MVKTKNFCRYKKFLRYIRKWCYKFIDFIGKIIFSLLRLSGVLEQIVDFKKENVKNILIIRIDRIGDLILSTPAIRAVKESFPGAKVSLLFKEYTEDLVVNNPHIDKLLIYGKNEICSDFDLAIALHPGFKENYLTFSSGAKYRAGYTGWGGGFFLTHKLSDDRDVRIRHEVESALEVVGAVGCKTANKSLEVSITSNGERFTENFLKINNVTNSFVIIHPGAKQEYIRWKKEGFAEVADRLIKEKKVKVVLTGDIGEKQLIDEMTSLMEEKPCVATGLRLTQLVSLIKRCKLFVGNSTGPMHIAAALGVPVVAIFGNVHSLDSYQEWGPWGNENIVVSKNLNCPGCHPGDCKTFDCLKKILVADVYAAVEKRLMKE